MWPKHLLNSVDQKMGKGLCTGVMMIKLKQAVNPVRSHLFLGDEVLSLVFELHFQVLLLSHALRWRKGLELISNPVYTEVKLSLY